MSVPDFGQLVEYVTEGPVYHRVALGQHDLSTREVVDAILRNYVKVFRITDRVASLEGDDLNDTIPEGVRARVNVWLANRSYPTVPTGWTYRQLLVAIRDRVSA